MDEHFLEVAKATGAEWGEQNYFRGILNYTPFLLKQTASESPGYFFKFRKKGRPRLPGLVVRPAPVARPTPSAPKPGTPSADEAVVWHDQLAEEYAKAGIRCDVEDDYIFLWIDQPLGLTPMEIASLALDCVHDHAGLLPDQYGLCLTCGKTGEASLAQSNASVATVCPACLEEKLQSHAATVEKLNRSDAKFSFLLPLALLGGSVAWAAFWTGIDALLLKLHAEQIQVPSLLIVILAAVLGFCAGWPMGSILHRSGAVKRLPAGALATFAALVIVVCGEVLYALWEVYRLSGSFHLLLALRATLILAFGRTLLFSVIKLIFAGALGVAIYEVSKQKTRKMQL